MKKIDTYNFNGKKVLVRVDFNVPLDDKFQVTDTTRIDAAMPTIKKILSDGGAVILMSHLGRPKGGYEAKYSLKNILPYLSKCIGVQVKFAESCIGDSANKLTCELKPKEVLLLENLRFYKEEEKGDEAFAKKLALLGDVYVNDAFGTAHRAHASTSVIAKFFPNDKMFGYLMADEVASINKVLHSEQHPSTAILGGAKVSDKILIIRHLLEKVDNLIIGGGMMFTFIKAMGYGIGKSLVEEDKIPEAKAMMELAKQKGVNLLLPVDAVVADKFANDANKKECVIENIPDGWMGLDIGAKTIAQFSTVIMQSKTIFWNGPMGVFEMSSFENGTKSVAEAIAKVTSQGAFSLIGGGDSVSAIHKYKLHDKVSYVSTGGGAMLEFIEGNQLPGVKAIEE